MQTRVPVDVVVDTWNLRRQANDVLGHNRFPSMAGIRDHLRKLGFEADRIFAALAAKPHSAQPSSRVSKALARSQDYIDEVGACSFADLMSGRLTDRSGVLEEKLVDVLCAVRICRSAMEIATRTTKAKAIVVLSEDIDLTPAFEMARGLGVPVFAAANETVYTRPGDWIVLGDAAMEEICRAPAEHCWPRAQAHDRKAIDHGTDAEKVHPPLRSLLNQACSPPASDRGGSCTRAVGNERGRRSVEPLPGRCIHARRAVSSDLRDDRRSLS